MPQSYETRNAISTRQFCPLKLFIPTHSEVGKEAVPQCLYLWFFKSLFKPRFSFSCKGSGPRVCTVLPCTKIYPVKARVVIYYSLKPETELAATANLP